jgi:hypothetical protein
VCSSDLGWGEERAMLTQDLYDAAIKVENQSRIEIAYIIAGTFSFICAFIGLAFYVFGTPKASTDDKVNETKPPKKSYRDILIISKVTGAPAKFSLTLCFLFFFYYLFVSGAQVTLYTWLYTFALESDLPFTRQEAASLDAVCKMSSLVGRILGIFIVRFVPIQPYLIFSIYSSVAMGSGLITIGLRDKTSLFIFACGYELLMAPVWPGAVSWLDKYIIVVAVVYMFSNLGTSFSAMIFQPFTGWLFANKPPESVMYFIFGCTVMVAIIFTVMQVMGSHRGTRYKKKEKCDDIVLAVNEIVIPEENSITKL